jgi:ssDNA-binding Zn-finger/Zn-ribbon topoisomerase 1
MQMEMQMDTDLKKCPDCGGAMEPQALVSTGRHFSRWWRCSNGKCRAEWLLPMASAERAAADLAWTV